MSEQHGAILGIAPLAISQGGGSHHKTGSQRDWGVVRLILS